MGVPGRSERREKRQQRVRKKIQGKPDRPRLCVFRSNKNIYAQIIDDTTGNTLVSASSLSKDLRSVVGKDSGNRKGAAVVGAAVAKLALDKGIRLVAFDRNGFLYHGRVRALSEAARQGGLVF